LFRREHVPWTVLAGIVRPVLGALLCFVPIGDWFAVVVSLNL